MRGFSLSPAALKPREVRPLPPGVKNMDMSPCDPRPYFCSWPRHRVTGLVLAIHLGRTLHQARAIMRITAARAELPPGSPSRPGLWPEAWSRPVLDPSLSRPGLCPPQGPKPSRELPSARMTRLAGLRTAGSGCRPRALPSGRRTSITQRSREGRGAGVRGASGAPGEPRGYSRAGRTGLPIGARSTGLIVRPSAFSTQGNRPRKWASMIPLMSSWQPPQPVPARVAADTSGTVPQPSVTAVGDCRPADPGAPADRPGRVRGTGGSGLVRSVQAQQQRPVGREFRAAFEELHQLGRGARHAHGHEAFQHAGAGGHLDVAAVLGIGPLGDLQPGPAVHGPGGQGFLVPGVCGHVPGHGHVHAAGLEHDHARQFRRQGRQGFGPAAPDASRVRIVGEPFGLPPARPTSPEGPLAVRH